MKKILSCLFVLLILCGCKGKTVEPITENIEFTAKFEYANQNFACKCKAGQNGDFTAEFFEPQTIKGLKYTHTADNSSVEFMGLTYKLGSKDSAFLAAADKMYEALCACKNNAATLKEKEFVLENENYTVYFSETGLPIKIIIDGVEIEITDVKQS